MEKIHHISPRRLTINAIRKIMKEGYGLKLSKESKEKVDKCRRYLVEKLEESDNAYYGINTGFGSLCNIRISNDELEDLQTNLVMSHACGTGEEVPKDIVKLMLLLKAQSLSYGFSGVRVKTVEGLIRLFNFDILPVIYQQGSLGASGDLSPLAHLSLPLIGLGEVWSNGRKMATPFVLNQLFWRPLRLQPKEGLALLNGTQFSLAYGVWCLMEAERLSYIADLTAAISIDAFECSLAPFDKRLHNIRPHKGQVATARFIREILQGSQIAEKEKRSVQDPYAFRCVPQVHGASKAAIEHIKSVFTTEVNSVTDNPNLFYETDAILSGGNFHAQPLALPLDYLAIALSELGSISERRTFQLISGKQGLPPFLAPQYGLHSGLMIPQYTAASIASQNKQLCTPASVDSIVSCNGQEDHVSMAANAGTKAYRVVKNVERILAIEFLTATQALEFRRPDRSSPKITEIIKEYRKTVSRNEKDRILSEDIKKTIAFLKNIDV